MQRMTRLRWASGVVATTALLTSCGSGAEVSSGSGNDGAVATSPTQAAASTAPTAAPSTEPTAEKPAVGAVAYDKRLCEVISTDAGSTPFVHNGQTYCYVFVGLQVYDAFRQADLVASGYNYKTVKPVFRRNFGDVKGKPQFKTLMVKSSADGLWRRATIGTDTVEVARENKWFREGASPGATLVKQLSSRAGAANWAILPNCNSTRLC